MPRPVGFVGHLFLQQTWEYHSANFIGQFVECMHMQESYCKYPGMKLKNWNAATCQTLAQIPTTLVHIKHSNPCTD